MREPTITLRYQQPLSEFIDGINPPVHLSCDFLGDPLAFGIQIFPLRVYEVMNKLRAEAAEKDALDALAKEPERAPHPVS